MCALGLAMQRQWWGCGATLTTHSQSTETVVNRKQWPTSSAAGYLMSLAPWKTSPSSQRGQTRVPGSGNTLCEGHERRRGAIMCEIAWLTLCVWSRKGSPVAGRVELLSVGMTHCWRRLSRERDPLTGLHRSAPTPACPYRQCSMSWHRDNNISSTYCSISRSWHQMWKMWLNTAVDSMLFKRFKFTDYNIIRHVDIDLIVVHVKKYW